MISRDIYKARQYDSNLVMQPYAFTVQDKYIKNYKNLLSKYLREVLLKGVPKALFCNPCIGSMSSSKEFIAVDCNYNRIYKENKPDLEAKGIVVTHYPNSTHIFSRICLESQGFVDKTFKHENKILTNAQEQHAEVQKYFLHSGFAEAVEVPVWNALEDKTGFIDIICLYEGYIWILDYKPQAISAKNKYAVGQLRGYEEALMARLLSIYNKSKKKQEWNIKGIKLAYFDEKDTFIINS